MNHLSLFINHTIEDKGRSGNIDILLNSVGDWCLKPVRCLFNGKIVEVYQDSGITKVHHKKEYGKTNKRTLSKIIKAIILFVPGVVFGSAIKGLSYCSKSIRERHNLAILHFTPINRILRSDNEPLDLKGILESLKKEHENNHLNQKTETLIIYAKPGTEIDLFGNEFIWENLYGEFAPRDPLYTIFKEIRAFKPKKVITVGAKFSTHWNNRVYKPYWQPMLEAKPKKCKIQSGIQLDETAFVRLIKPGQDKSKDETCIFPQWKVDSIKRALLDTPPKKSIFSSERYTRIYYVEK
jgi:hypothetical protein